MAAPALTIQGTEPHLTIVSGGFYLANINLITGTWTFVGGNYPRIDWCAKAGVSREAVEALAYDIIHAHSAKRSIANSVHDAVYYAALTEG